jgi:hypothetical protein
MKLQVEVDDCYAFGAAIAVEIKVDAPGFNHMLVIAIVPPHPIAGAEFERLHLRAKVVKIKVFSNRHKPMEAVFLAQEIRAHNSLGIRRAQAQST